MFCYCKVLIFSWTPLPVFHKGCSPPLHIYCRLIPVTIRPLRLDVWYDLEPTKSKGQYTSWSSSDTWCQSPDDWESGKLGFGIPSYDPMTSSASNFYFKHATAQDHHEPL